MWSSSRWGPDLDQADLSFGLRADRERGRLSGSERGQIIRRAGLLFARWPAARPLEHWRQTVGGLLSCVGSNFRARPSLSVWGSSCQAAGDKHEHESKSKHKAKHEHERRIFRPAQRGFGRSADARTLCA